MSEYQERGVEGENRRDVFISHAGPDKDTMIRPFVEQLAAREISYWFDEAELRWGQSLLKTISEGLESSRYVLVFISDAFLERPWPEAELRAALSREVSSGVVRVLPVFACDKEKILSRHPFLSDKTWLTWKKNPAAIIDELELLLGRSFQSQWAFSHPAWFRGDVWLKVMPRLENSAAPHTYRITWGRWGYEGELKFSSTQAAILAFRKIAEKDSYPIHVEISPPAFVSSGRGAPIIDINRGWRLLDREGYAKASLAKTLQSFLRDTDPAQESDGGE